MTSFELRTITFTSRNATSTVETPSGWPLDSRWFGEARIPFLNPARGSGFSVNKVCFLFSGIEMWKNCGPTIKISGGLITVEICLVQCYIQTIQVQWCRTFQDHHHIQLGCTEETQPSCVGSKVSKVWDSKSIDSWFKVIHDDSWDLCQSMPILSQGLRKCLFFFPGGIINDHCPWALWVVGLGFCPSRRSYLVLVDPTCPLIFSTIQVWLSQPCIFELHVAFFFPEYMPPAGTLALPVLLPHWQRPRRCRGAEQRCETWRPPQASCPRRIQHSWLVLPNQDPG